MKTLEKREVQKTKGKKVKKKRIGLKILLVILIIIAALGIYFVVRSNQLGGGKQGMIATLLGHNENTLKNLDPIYCLLMGESVSGDSRLTDTMIVCKYDPKTQKAAMLSIPRDTYTGTAANRETASPYYKINTAYNMGENPEKAVAAVNKLTGLDIKYYVLVNTEALKELVDAIGGVYFDVPIDMYYTWDTEQDLYIDLKKGYQLLDGDKAEQVVRFRHNNNGSSYPVEYGGENHGRMRTQMAFLKAVAEQTLKPENILKIGEFVDIFYKNVKTNISIDDIKDYIPYAVNFSTENLETAEVPGADDKAKESGIWFFYPDAKKTAALVDELFLNDGEEDEEEQNTITNNTVSK